jgi:hypothetical protein
MPFPVATGIAAGFQLLELILDRMERHSKGELTDEQLDAEWAVMGVELTGANVKLSAAIEAHRARNPPAPT